MARIPLDEAIALSIASATPLSLEEVSLAHALGRVLGEDVVYPHPLPAFDHAAMDGYALAGAAAAGARFAVRGESRAGAPSDEPAGAETAVAISTGAAMPEGTTTVVPWEDVERTNDGIVLRTAARAGQHVRSAGEDAPLGALAARKGTRLRPRHLGALATADRRAVPVFARPTVVLLSTGDELVAPGTPRARGVIVDSNGPMIEAMAIEAGAVVRRARVPDRPGALEEALAAARDVDLVVTIGGAADGDHDHVARAVASTGGAWIFRGVAIKPGKPVALARTLGTRLLALPGNPGSAFVTFALLGRPLVAALAGDRDPAPERVRVRTLGAIRGAADRAVLAYGRLATEAGVPVFAPGPPAPSGAVPAVASASALGLVAAGASVAAGDTIEVVLVDPR